MTFHAGLTFSYFFGISKTLKKKLGQGNINRVMMSQMMHGILPLAVNLTMAIPACVRADKPVLAKGFPKRKSRPDKKDGQDRHDENLFFY